MKKRIAQYLSLALLISLLGISYLLLDRLLSIKSEHGIKQAKYMYSQPMNTIDVAFMGSSHIHCNVNTALLWEQYGIASYDYSGAEQPLWMTYYYLKEICKTQNPKLIVIDLYSPARYKDDYQYNYMDENVYGMRFSVNKAMMLYASCEPDRIMDFFPSMGVYNSRYISLSENDWKEIFRTNKEKAAFKGYTPYYITVPQEEPELTQEYSGGITLKSEIYLQKIIEYCREHEMELFLMVSPYITTDEDELVYNRVHEIADMNGINFNSTNYYYDSMDLDFDEDFNDISHLNYRGSCKFSEYLGSELKQMYEIPDRRGEARWESWDRHVQAIHESAREAGFSE